MGLGTWTRRLLPQKEKAVKKISSSTCRMSAPVEAGTPGATCQRSLQFDTVSGGSQPPYTLKQGVSQAAETGRSGGFTLLSGIENNKHRAGYTRRDMSASLFFSRQASRRGVTARWPRLTQRGAMSRGRTVGTA